VVLGAQRAEADAHARVLAERGAQRVLELALPEPDHLERAPIDGRSRPLDPRTHHVLGQVA
jgi:hypothetical protein